MLFTLSLASLAGGCTSTVEPVEASAIQQPEVYVEAARPATLDGSFCVVGTNAQLGGMAVTANAPQHAIGKCTHPRWKESDVIVLYFGDDGEQASKEYLDAELNKFLNPSVDVHAKESVHAIEQVAVESGPMPCDGKANCDESAASRQGVIVHFAFDSDMPDNAEVLADLARNVVSSAEGKGSFYVVGHTDSIGSSSYNSKLSLRRAERVRNILVDNGVQPDAVIAVGKSFDEPVASNDTEAGRAMNRRAEITEK